MERGAGTDEAALARDAAARGAWQEAVDLFMELDAGASLDPGDLPLLAEVAYAAGHLDVTITAWERVHATCLEAGERVAAGGAAARVAMHLLFDTALMAPVRGWLRRAEKLLDGEPDSPSHAWYAVVRTYERFLSGDRDSARSWAERAVDLGSALEPAAGAIGQVAVARLLILDGEVARGLALLEEVGVATTSGDLDPLSTGVVYCELVCALQGVAQYDLAEEWTEVMERWCETNAVGSLRGRCRVHRAEVLRLRGACGEAEDEAVLAYEELRPYLRRELGWPLTELGQIRLQRGDVDGAEDALRAAHQAGWDPHPGLAIVHLVRGDVATAAESIRDALDRPVSTPSKERPPNSSLQRAPLLSAQVEIEIAAGALGRAGAAADELEEIAHRFQSRALVAHAELAQGRVRLAAGEPAVAEAHLSEAVRIWRDIGAPYELAVARTALGDAYRARGHDHQAELELDAARHVFQQLAVGRDRTGEDSVGRVPRPDPPNRVLREGDHWTLTFAGRTVHIRDLKGVRYLARLLADPGREFHALDLVAAEADRPSGVDGRPDPVDDALARTDAGDMLDDQARSAYRRRLAEIDDDIEDARRAHDIGRISQAEDERDFLVRELSRAFGLGGRKRRAGAASERARVAVTRALRTAISHIGEHHEPLGEHLHHAVRTGTYCSYAPDPAAPTFWQV